MNESVQPEVENTPPQLPPAAEASGGRGRGVPNYGGAPSAEDPLLECLEYLARHFGRPKSKDVLKAGLPLKDGRFDPFLFLKAAERIGIRARVLKRSLGDISEHVLPAVLVLKGGRACVLLAHAEGKAAQVLLPEAGGGVGEMSIADLSQDYTGYTIFARPEVRPHEDSRPQKRFGAWWFWGTIFKNWWIYSQVGIAAIFINLFALASPLFIMTVYDRVIPNNATETLWVLAFGFMSVVAFDFILKMLRAYFIDTAGRKADVIIACRLFDQVLDMQMASKPASAGAFANNLREFETLRDFFTSATLASLIDLPFVFVFIFVLWLVSGPIALVLAAAVPIILAYGLILQIPLNYVVRKNFAETQRKHGVLVETINGLEVIKSIGAEGRMRGLWEGLVGLSSLSGQRARTLSASGVSFASTVQQLTTIAIIVFGVYMIGKGEMSVGALIATIILGGRALGPLAQVAQLLTRFHQSRASLKALNGIMKAPVERPATKTFVHCPVLKGGISLVDVTFTYPGAGEHIIKGLNLSIKAGERVGVIGKIGSGKSTISKLLLGLYEPDDGMILFDGTDIHQIDPVDLRRNIGYVQQDPLLFRGTLRENITAAAPSADDGMILRAASYAGIENFIVTNPLGFDLEVGERGDGLSGGQRQAITVARALLTSPNILVFDEPTSSMDTRSEMVLKQSLKKYLNGKTLVLATHRASLLSLVDRIVVVDGGRLVADGPRNEVISALSAGRIGSMK